MFSDHEIILEYIGKISLYLPITMPVSHYNDVIMGAMGLTSPASRLFAQPFIQAQIKENNESSASLAFVLWIHRSVVNSPHKGSVTRKKFPFDDVIMAWIFLGI